MSSMLNPLHGGNLTEAAKQLADKTPLSEIKDADQQRKEEARKFHMIFLLSSMLLVFYISGSGLFGLLHEQDALVYHDEVRDVEAYRRSSNPFHNFFCTGIKTSNACYTE